MQENVIIFETRLYNLYLSKSEVRNSDFYKVSLQDKNQFITHGQLNMRLIRQKFVTHFTDLYGDSNETLIEDDG